MLLTSYVAPLISGGKKVETCIQFSIPTHIPSYRPLRSATSKHIHYPPLRHASYIPSNRPFIHPSVMENHIHTYTYTHSLTYILRDSSKKKFFACFVLFFFVFFHCLHFDCISGYLLLSAFCSCCCNCCLCYLLRITFVVVDGFVWISFIYIFFLLRLHFFVNKPI